MIFNISPEILRPAYRVMAPWGRNYLTADESEAGFCLDPIDPSQSLDSIHPQEQERDQDG